MAKVDVLDILRSKKMDPMEFHFENLWIPPMHFYLTPQDVEELRKIATSVRLSSKIQLKYQMIDNIMKARGFKRFSAGTNRVVYRCLEDTRFLVKIAVDKVGMQDNPLEYKNQFLLQPFVTKMFYVSPCGTVGFSERVLPIKNKEEFRQIASDVFDILVNKILGLYVVEDVGTRYFMNWGIRLGFGPVLLDYPYVYKLDGDKLFCNWTNPETGVICDGEIDYDQGFNHLVCTRCGKTYLATNLRDDSIDNKIVIRKGGFQMKVVVKKGDQVIAAPIPVDDVMKRPTKIAKKNNNLVVSIKRPNEEIETIDTKTTEVVDTNSPYNNSTVPSTVIGNMEDSKTDKEIECADHNTNSTADKVLENVNTVSTSDNVESDKIESEYKGDEPEPNNEDDEEDIVLASDAEIARRNALRENARNQPHDEKGQFISTGSKKKKNKDKRNRNGSNFIPSGSLYTNGN